MRMRIDPAADPYLRERLADLEELGNRLLDHLSGAHERPGARGDGEDVVIVARALGAAPDLMEYDPARLRAVVLEEGSPTAHAAIVARALEIPMVGQVRGALGRFSDGEAVIVDGSDGQVRTRPDESEIAVLEERAAERARRADCYRALRDLPARTRDGVDMRLEVNIGTIIDSDRLDELGVAGIGLCRTEIPFMTAPRFPGVEEQTDLYSPHPRCSRRPPGGVSHTRHRRRQAPSLPARGGGGEPGDGLAGDPHRPRPPRGPAPPIAGAAARRGGARPAHHVSDDRHRR